MRDRSLYGQKASGDNWTLSKVGAGPSRSGGIRGVSVESIRRVRVRTCCLSCTDKCCSQPYDWVYLTEAEIAALEVKSKLDRSKFVSLKHNLETGERFSVLELPCAFLSSGGKCTVYDARPLVCRAFPFYPDPLSGTWTFLPTQCGGNLLLARRNDTKGWGIGDFDQVISRWLRQLRSEAGEPTPWLGGIPSAGVD